MAKGKIKRDQSGEIWPPCKCGIRVFSSASHVYCHWAFEEHLSPAGLAGLIYSKCKFRELRYGRKLRVRTRKNS